jgi:RimJ/RimL family protein N-acetyltransferase
MAKDKHLEKIYGYVMANNYKMLNLCNGIGFKAEQVDDDTLKMYLDVS